MCRYSWSPSSNSDKSFHLIARIKLWYICCIFQINLTLTTRILGYGSVQSLVCSTSIERGSIVSTANCGGFSPNNINRTPSVPTVEGFNRLMSIGPHLSQLYIWISNIVSEWLLFNTNSAIFQLYHGENKLIFNEMMIRSALY